MSLLARISRWLRPRQPDPVVQALYGQLVAQSRCPAFYRDLGVPDTLDGRFDLLSLHAALLINRLAADRAPQSHALAQALFDLMFTDMDRSLRETGVGDMMIGKHVKRMADAFHGRARTYDEALAQDATTPLMAALDRNLYGTVATEENSLAIMAAYVRREADRLRQTPFSAILAGKLDFGAP